MNRLLRHLCLFALSYALVACDSPPQEPVAIQSTTSKSTAEPALIEALQQYKYAQIHTITRVNECVSTLATDIHSFLETPTQSALVHNQQALQHCLDMYVPVHALLSNQQNPALTALTQSLYSTPILPGYVDYLQQYPNSGIVSDITLPLSEQSLRDQQGLTDSGEVSTGFEVIAFLLSGEQRYNTSQANRPVSDFTAPTSTQLGEKPSNNHSDRRRQYLSIATTLLQKDLLAIKDHLSQQTDTKNKLPDQLTAQTSATQILNTMLHSIQQQNQDSLSLGYWQLLKYQAPQEEGTTLASYLKWPQQSPDLSSEAFSAQLQASLQRLR